MFVKTKKMRKSFLLVIVFSMFLFSDFNVLSAKDNPENPVGNKTESQCIYGSVMDLVSGGELTGVEVKVLGTDIIVYTDFNGEFRIENLDEEEYTLEIDYISYTKKIIRGVKVSREALKIKIETESLPRTVSSTAAINPQT